MEITFTRTGERRYRVVARREAVLDLVMEPAPGFDSHLPHDLVRFLVERHWEHARGHLRRPGCRLAMPVRFARSR